MVKMVLPQLLFIIQFAFTHAQSAALINSFQPNTERLVFCGPQEYCIGGSCDFACNKSTPLVVSVDANLGGGIMSAVDVEQSTGCVFYFPSTCQKCMCISQASSFKSQNELKSCEPCQFKSIAWFPKVEREKCGAEICPILFPTSCGMNLITSKGLAALSGTSFPNGLWIHFMGDSILRGIFSHAVSFLTIMSDHIQLFWSKNGTMSLYMCCRARHSQSRMGTGSLDQCELHYPEVGETNATTRPNPMVQRAAAEILKRRARGDIPICVSFTFSPFTDSFREAFAQLDAVFASTGVRPTSIVINPGIWELRTHFELHEIVENLRTYQAACAALFNAGVGGYAAASYRGKNHTCMLLTTADTAYTNEDAAKYNHLRLHHNIQGYNAAIKTAWLDGGMPLLDAGALSLHPAVANSIDGDKLHYGPGEEPGNPVKPFNPLCWQMILHTITHNGSHPCEAQSGPAAVDLVSKNDGWTLKHRRHIFRGVLARFEARLERRLEVRLAHQHRRASASREQLIIG